jgi:dihydroxyacetone kinase
MGVSLSAGTVPAAGTPSFTLANDEVELGLGIHGEPGVERARLASADEIADQLIDPICREQGLKSGDQVALFINNLGATTLMELAIVGRRALARLRSHGVVVRRALLGSFMTSLEMAGVSFSVLRVDEDRLRWLDAATNAPAWPRGLGELRSPAADEAFEPAAHVVSRTGSRETAIENAIAAACHALLANEARLTELDQIVGDGDLGITLARGARAVLEALPDYPLDDSGETLRAVGQTLQRTLGGSSGPLYGVLFVRAGTALKRGEDWPRAAAEACHALSELGGAKQGDKTMLDALYPFAEHLASGLEDAMAAAEQGVANTAHMKPRRGRSSYLGERSLGTPDPGAVAVSLWLRAVASSLLRSE